MSSEDRFILLNLTIGILALLGLLVIFWLMIAWRRFNERQARLGKRQRSVTEQTDLWHESGRRFVPPPPEAPPPEALPPEAPQPPESPHDPLDGPQGPSRNE